MNNTLQAEPISKYLPSFLALWNVRVISLGGAWLQGSLECLWHVFARNMSLTTPLTAMGARVWNSLVDGLNEIGSLYLWFNVTQFSISSAP